MRISSFRISSKAWTRNSHSSESWYFGFDISMHQGKEKDDMYKTWYAYAKCWKSGSTLSCREGGKIKGLKEKRRYYYSKF